VIDDVLEAMRRTADLVIMPRFRALQDHEIEEKSPGEVVTLVDREAEAMITATLQHIRPDAVVIGEEAAHANPSLIDALQTAQPAWLLDPLDGTANFVAGSEDFAVMVAFVEGGRTTHAWIWRPAVSESWTASLGEGTRRNGGRIVVSKPARERPRGAILTRFLDAEHRAYVEKQARELGEVLPGLHCAGVEYPGIVIGAQDFAMFKRTLPWDHAPGAFVLREAGGVARRWDGSEYEPTVDGTGLIAAADEATWERVASVMLPGTRAA
jgi:fructose-1,6-bisphosphatase/inositol monophosphatase family enzyme